MRQWILDELQNGKISKIYDASMQSLEDRLTEDGGNGEQCIWFCCAFLRIRNTLNNK